ncbi:MAG: CHAP domain-containing protein, partial [Lachnospiraceae bacterium]|nr:CHAP domain-containing protein [Lachnospiraceae bacterium]
DNREWKSFMEWCGSSAEEFGDWPDKLAVSAYTRYVDKYHERVLEINEMTRNRVNTVFENVAEIDTRYAGRMRECQEKIKEQIATVNTMTEFMVSMTDGNPNMVLITKGSVNETSIKMSDEHPDEMRRMNQWMKGRLSDYVRIRFGDRLQDDDYRSNPVIKGSEILNRYLCSQLDETGHCIYEGKVDEITAIIKRNYPWMLSSLYVTDCYSTSDSKIVLKHLMEIVDIINQNENIINNLIQSGESEDYIILRLLDLKEQYPEFYNRINQSDIDEILIYFRYVEMNNMVAVACNEVDNPRGIEKTNEKGEPLNDVYYNTWFYGEPTEKAWCAVFVLWCANEVDLLDGELLPTYEQASGGNFEGVRFLRGYFENKENRYHSYVNDRNYIPCIGDFVFMESSVGEHVGIVVGYDNEKNILYTVEGNSDDKVSFRIRDWDGTYVKGLASNGGDVAGIPENIDDFLNNNNSSTR